MKTELGLFRLRNGLLFLELGAALGVLIFAIAVIPYRYISWSGGGWVAAITFLVLGLALLYVLIGVIGVRAGTLVARLGSHLRLRDILIIGVVCQTVFVLIAAPIPAADPKVYIGLASRLANGLSFMDDGRYAFMPPGFPMFLAPFIAIFGSGAVVVANALLYFVSAISCWHIGMQLFSARIGVLAAFLFTIWPSRFLSAGIASKQNLTIAMLLAGTALCLAALDSTSRRSWLLAIASGCCFGLATLAQPGLMLFVLAIPVVFRGWIAPQPRAAVARIAVIITITFVCLLPWHIRNCVVFDGEFCGLSTNGGSVFYRANNPIASGLWMEDGEVSIKNLPELEQNRVGYELGKSWIRDKPYDFLELSIKKLVYLLSGDSFGAYWSILRGQGLEDHVASEAANSDFRMASYYVANAISLVFWLLVVAWSCRILLQLSLRGDLASREALLPLVYPLLYSAAVFSVFESGDRQRMAAEGLLIVLAAISLGDKQQQTSSRTPIF